ncbi:trypsin-like serine protease [Streptosporangium sp. NPDC001681]|uniref:trypsin-like serine protease n=1 Tax=Streptosporangium sp. NPDC001681 TaxID=3154395 RepID=UPI003321EC93
MIMAFALGTTPAVGASSPDPTSPEKPKPIVSNEKPSYLTPEDEKIFLAQEPLKKASDILFNAIDRTSVTGFTGIQYLDDSKVILWWKKGAPISEKVEAALSEARKIAPVEIGPASYSEKELEVAADNIKNQVGTDEPIHGVQIPVNGSGLRIMTNPGTNQAKTLSMVESSVPLETVESPRVELITRCNDSSPWYGGGAFRNTSVGVNSTCIGSSANFTCSFAFGVHESGVQYLLTARHCGQVGNSIQDGNGDPVGTVARGNKSHDLMLVKANALPYMFDGNNDNNARHVSGWRNTAVGEMLCISGATSGAHCSMRVTDYRTKWVNASMPGDTTSTRIEDLSAATYTTGATATRPGDSGGAVYSLNGSDVWAQGIMNARLDPGVDGNYEVLYFMDFGRIRLSDGFTNIAPLT